MATAVFDIRQRPNYMEGSDRSLATRGMQGIGGVMPPHISIARNRFTLVDAAGNEQPVQQLYLDVVVLDVNPNPSKVYYEGAYDPNEVDRKPPTCFSDNGLAPSREASIPQAPACAGCQFNAWGSEISQTGAKVKACRDYKKIAVFVPLNKGIQFQLRIPPNTLKIWKAYCANIGGQGADMCDIITRITFDEQEQGTLNFEPVGWVPQKFMEWYKEILASHKLDQLTGVLDKPIEGQITARPAAALGSTLPPPRAQMQEPEAEIMPPQQASQAAPKKPGRPVGSTNKPKAPAAPPAQTTAPVNAVDTDADPLEIPDFLKRTSPKMEDAPAPDEALSSAIDDAFNM